MTKQKAKRRLFNFDFSQPYCGVHLVGADQGGPANGIQTLCIKNRLNDTTMDDLIGNEFIQKQLEQVEIKLSMQEFLRRFFEMYYDDAELLTKLIGLQTEAEYKDATQGQYDYFEEHQSWLEERLKSFSIMKALYEGDNSVKLTPTEYVDIVKCQHKFEKSLNNYTGEIGVDKVQIEKSRFDALEKAEAELVTKASELNTAQAALTAAQEEIKTMQAEVAEIKKAAEIAEVKQDLTGIVKAEDLDTKAEKMLLVKAASPEAYQEMLATMKQAKDLIEKSALFEEQGNPDEASQEEIQKAARRKAIAGE